MTGSWIGPADIVAKALEIQDVQVVDGKFRLEGPEIEYLFKDDAGDNQWNIVEVKPETKAFLRGNVPISVVAILASFQYSCKVTFGLPIAPRKQ
jgi:hypothetical protein